MIIDDFYVHWAGRSFRPPKADPPLAVNADRKLSSAVASERFQAVTGQCSQISKACGGLKPIKTHLGLPRKARELLDMSSGGKPLGRLVPIADHHGARCLPRITHYVNSNSVRRDQRFGQHFPEGQARHARRACRKADGCPRAFMRPQHSHMSEVYAINTADTRLSDEIWTSSRRGNRDRHYLRSRRSLAQ